LDVLKSHKLMVPNVNVIALLCKPQVFRVGLRVVMSSRWLVVWW
jgi:hypothetical protein